MRARAASRILTLVPLPFGVDEAVESGLLLQRHVASILGVTRQRVNQLSHSEDFPAPVKVIGRHPLWRRADVEAWRESK